jgi:O-antigen/teichoic acid export membrane protein
VHEDPSFDIPAEPGPTPGSLKQAVFASGGWLLALRLAERVLGLVRLVVLARLLAPDDLGLFGIAMLAMATIETLSQTGFNEAIIRRGGDARAYLGTAWTVHFLRGVGLAALLWAAAPAVAGFFDEAAAAPLLRALCLNLAIVGLTNTGVLLLERDLRFRRVAAISAAGSLVDIGVSVVSAFALRSPWALVYGVLAGNLVRVAVSYLAVPPVRPRFDRGRARELSGFGGWVWGANLLHFAANQGDDIIVGRMLGTPALGVYRMAFAYAALPATEITHVISRVTFPAYTRLREDVAALRRGYLTTVQAVALVAAPLAAGIAVMAESFVRLILEPAWQPLVAPLQILALWGFIRALAATTGPVLYALDRPQTVTRLVGLKLVVLLLLIFPLTARFGLAGTSWAVVLAAALNYPVAALVVGRLVGCGVSAYARACVLPAVAAGAMAAAVRAGHRSLPADFGLTAFVGSIAGGALLYSLIVVLAGPLAGYAAFEPLRGSVRRRGNGNGSGAGTGTGG